MLEKLIALRKELHQNPEISGIEEKTAEIIIDFLSKNTSAKIISNVGGNGIMAVFNSDNDGQEILFRADMDAIPIQEMNSFSYKSLNIGVSHKCGHDGHMAILSGLAINLSENPPQKGKAILLYQPNEETGIGAQMVYQDEKFKFYQPDFVFALHNIPGFRKNQIIIKDQVFTSASTGLNIILEGKISHAAYPEKGINPSMAIAELIENFYNINKNHEWFKSKVLITPVSIHTGDNDFGISPGRAEIKATLRAELDEDLDMLITFCRL